MQQPRSDLRTVLALLLTAIGAAMVLISLFLDWYRVGDDDFEYTLSGWDSFEIVDLLLLALALLALTVAVFRLVGRPVREWLGPAAGGAALAIVLLQLVNSPFSAFGGDVDVGIEVGAWLAFAGALLLTAGGALDMLRGIQITTAPRAADPPPPAAPPPPGVGSTGGEPPTQRL